MNDEYSWNVEDGTVIITDECREVPSYIVDSNVYIKCTKTVPMGDVLTIHNCNVRVEDCPNAEFIAKSMQVYGGAIRIKNCPKLKRLSEGVAELGPGQCELPVHLLGSDVKILEYDE